MHLHIGKLLDPSKLQLLRALIETIQFTSGESTAGWHAKLVKHNRQAIPSPELVKAQGIVSEALLANEVFRAHALPSKLLPPLLSRYATGSSYGRHVDDAIMGREQRLRTDLSVTVFIAEPADYVGGELEIQTVSGTDQIKFAAGDAVVYPSTLLHEVKPVTSGERIVFVTWVESLIRRGDAREILFDLDRARRTLFAKDGKSEVFDLLSKVHANLLREWSEF